MESLTRGARTSCGAWLFSFWLRQTQRGESWEHRWPPPSRASSRLLAQPHVPPTPGAGIFGAGGEVAAGLGHEPCWWSRGLPSATSSLLLPRAREAGSRANHVYGVWGPRGREIM